MFGISWKPFSKALPKNKTTTAVAEKTAEKTVVFPSPVTETQPKPPTDQVVIADKPKPVAAKIAATQTYRIKQPILVKVNPHYCEKAPMMNEPDPYWFEPAISSPSLDRLENDQNRRAAQRYLGEMRYHLLRARDTDKPGYVSRFNESLVELRKVFNKDGHPIGVGNPLELRLGDAKLLRNANLRGIDLRWIKPVTIDVTGREVPVSFRKSNLADAMLMGLIAPGADFRQAELWGSELTFADLHKARFEYADLRRLKQSKLANLEGATFNHLTKRDNSLDTAAANMQETQESKLQLLMRVLKSLVPTVIFPKADRRRALTEEKAARGVI